MKAKIIRDITTCSSTKLVAVTSLKTAPLFPVYSKVCPLPVLYQRSQEILPLIFWAMPFDPLVLFHSVYIFPNF